MTREFLGFAAAVIAAAALASVLAYARLER